jgi:hypothetical protein
MEVEAARREATGLNKRATLPKYLCKERELDNSSKANRTRAKGSPPEKTPLIKSYSVGVGEDDDV